MLDVTLDMVRPYILGDITDDFLTGMIGRAERQLLQIVPSLRDRVTTDPDLFVLAQDVVVAAVSRVGNNPTGIRQEMEGGYSVAFAAATVGAGLGFTDDELAMLRPAPAPAPVMGKPLRMNVPCHRFI